MQDEDRVASLDGLGPGHAAALLVGALVPDLAAAGLAPVHGEALGRGVQRRALRDGPRPQRPVDLEAEHERVLGLGLLLDHEAPGGDTAYGELLVALALDGISLRAVAEERDDLVHRRLGPFGVDSDDAVIVVADP